MAAHLACAAFGMRGSRARLGSAQRSGQETLIHDPGCDRLALDEVRPAPGVRITLVHEQSFELEARERGLRVEARDPTRRTELRDLQVRLARDQTAVPADEEGKEHDPEPSLPACAEIA